jgi:subtilisin-like proprotein convertase family protein
MRDADMATKTRMGGNLVAGCTALVLNATALGQIPTYAVEYLGQPASVSGIGSVAALNANGQFVTNYYVGAGQRAWVGGPAADFVQLPLPPGYASCTASDIDDAGVIVGTATPSSGRGAAVIWTPIVGGYAVQTRGGLPGHLYSSAAASNNRGDIVGLSCATGSSNPTPVWFRPDGAVVSLYDLGYPTTLFSVADINEQRVVCGDRYRLHLETAELQDLGLPTVPPGSTRYTQVLSVALNESDQVAAIGRLATSSGSWNILRYTDGVGWQVVSLWPLTYGGPLDIDNAGNVLMDSSSGSARDLIVYSDAAGGRYLPSSHLEAEALYWSPRHYGGRLNQAGQIVGYVLNINNSDQRFGLALLTPIGTDILPGDVNADGHVRLDDLCAFASNPIDLNGDGGVDAADERFLLARLAERGLTTQDCNANGLWDYCEITAGQAADCDRNGLPDACQPDCNGDGVPEACEADCNNNGTPDVCDIAAGTSRDCNGNGIPDECDGASTRTYTFTYAALSTPLFPYTTLAKTEFVRGAGVIADVNVRVHDDYRVGDVAIRLTHAGVTVTLTDRAGYPSQYDIGFRELGYDAILDDEGTGGFIENRGSYGGNYDPIVSPPSYRPNSPLSALDGLPIGGDWTLSLETFEVSPIAMLYDWSLTIEKAAVAVGACGGDVDGDGDVDLGDLSLLLVSFGLCSGDAGFNANADFDASGCVELSDLAVLLANFGL